jgi:hypothetical protein
MLTDCVTHLNNIVNTIQIRYNNVNAVTMDDAQSLNEYSNSKMSNSNIRCDNVVPKVQCMKSSVVMFELKAHYKAEITRNVCQSMYIYYIIYLCLIIIIVMSVTHLCFYNMHILFPRMYDLCQR